jgi:hypothetical protein
MIYGAELGTTSAPRRPFVPTQHVPRRHSLWRRAVLPRRHRLQRRVKGPKMTLKFSKVQTWIFFRWRIKMQKIRLWSALRSCRCRRVAICAHAAVRPSPFRQQSRPLSYFIFFGCPPRLPMFLQLNWIQNPHTLNFMVHRNMSCEVNAGTRRTHKRAKNGVIRLRTFSLYYAATQ